MRKQTPLTLLLAEDNEGHAGLIRRNLNRSGCTYVLHHFRDGEALVRHLFDPAFDLQQPYVVLLDIRMPGLDGMAVLHKLKSDPAFQRIPVFMVSTTDDPAEVNRCYQLGCNGYLTKPVDSDQLAHLIQQLGRFLACIQVPMMKRSDDSRQRIPT